MKSKIIILLFAFAFMLSGCSAETEEETNAIKETPNIRVSFKDYYTENHWNKQIVNFQMADLTHDGVEDYIVTVIYTDPTVTISDPAEMLEKGVVFVQVFDGSTTRELGELGTLLWEEQFAAAHVGNGQVNLVHRDGRDYLMTTDIYSQMGNFDFQYQVFSLDREGNVNIIEQQSLKFNTLVNGEQRTFTDKEKQEISDFKKNLEAWFGGAALLVAADVDLPKLLVSTSKQQYVPEDYYDAAFLEFLY